MTHSRLFLLLCIFAFSSAHAQNAWVFKGEKEGVKVYYQKTDGIYKLKLTTSVHSSLSGLIHLLGEVDRYPQWGYKVMESRLVERVSDMETEYYSRLDFPWPMNDRDLVMHSKMVQDPVSGIVTSTSKAKPNRLPLVPGVERIQLADTKWVLYPPKNGWVYLEYYIYSDPGGAVPDWLVNMAIDWGPVETIRGIKRIIREPQYQSVKLAYIKE